MERNQLIDYFELILLQFRSFTFFRKDCQGSLDCQCLKLFLPFFTSSCVGHIFLSLILFVCFLV